MLKKTTQFWTNLRPYEKAGTAALALGIIIAFAFIGWLFYDGNIVLGGKIDLEKAGQAGSFIAGTSGVCWALAGVFFFISALRIQSEELNAQISVMDQQREIFEQQSFETTFFNLVNKIETSREKFNFDEVDPFKYWSREVAYYGQDFYTFPPHERCEESDIYFDDPDINETIAKKAEKKLKEEFPLIARGLREDQFMLNSDLQFFYINIFQAIYAINDYGKRKENYFELLLSSLHWYEIRFIFYWAYVKDGHSAELFMLKTNNIPIQTNYLYSPDHAHYFKDND